MSDHVTVAVADGVATLVLDRPDKRNAMTLDMWLAISSHCAALAHDPTVRVLVVRGAGDHFCAGADIGGFTDTDPAVVRTANGDADTALAAFPKPTIAQVSGSCVGGGAGIAAACDLRFADATARIGITPARLGLIYPSPDIARIVGLIGPSATKHLLYSAELIDAERALRIGFVDEVVATPEALTERVTEFAALLATRRSLFTQMASKQLVDAAAAYGNIPADVSERWEAPLEGNPDHAEGVAAFLERRDPNFTWTPSADG